MIFLTGSTGFLGRELLGRLLLNNSRETICLLIRPDPQFSSSSKERASKLISEMFGSELVSRFLPRIQLLEGDLSEYNFGLGDNEFAEIAGKISQIYHCAANTNLAQNLEDARRINVGGTEQVIRLARSANKHDTIKSVTEKTCPLFHVSTAYVAGKHKGILTANDLDVNGPFKNAYEQSKAEAEYLVRAAGDLERTVFRPSIVVGNSLTGHTSAFNVIYIPAKLITMGLFSFFPALPNVPFDVVPVDYVADAIFHLSRNSNRSAFDNPGPLDSGAFGTAALRAYHISSGVGRESTPREILDCIIATFNKYRSRGMKLLIAPPLVPADLLALAQSSLSAAKQAMRIMERLVCDRINIFRQLVPFIPYMTSNPQFDTAHTLQALAASGKSLRGEFPNLEFPPLFASYAERLFKYCLDTEWGRLSSELEPNLNSWGAHISRLDPLPQLR